jgi:hypothetical protein
MWSSFRGPLYANINRLLVVASDEAISPFDKLKPDPSAPGVDNLKKEAEKLQQLRGLGITADDLTVRTTAHFDRLGLHAT